MQQSPNAMHADGSGGSDPIRSLVGFDRVMQLSPGQTAQVSFPMSARALTSVEEDGRRVGVAGVWKVLCEGVVHVVEVVA